jgi:hypothetical protein
MDLKKTKLEVDEILDAAKTIPSNRAETCSWFDDQWVSPEQYLEWAKVSLQSGGDCELVSAVANAKRAVCRVIDTLILNYHQEYFKKCNYPAKIDGLTNIGINVNSIIQELIIDPRNELEHKYKIPDSTQADHAVNVVSLFIDTMRSEFECQSVIAFNWNLQGGIGYSKKSGESIKFDGFTSDPMFFIDVFEEPTKIKIVDPQASEVRFALLRDFSKYNCLELGMYLRSHYSQRSYSNLSISKTGCQALKSQAGF